MLVRVCSFSTIQNNPYSPSMMHRRYDYSILQVLPRSRLITTNYFFFLFLSSGGLVKITSRKDSTHNALNCCGHIVGIREQEKAVDSYREYRNVQEMLYFRTETYRLWLMFYRDFHRGVRYYLKFLIYVSKYVNNMTVAVKAEKQRVVSGRDTALCLMLAMIL